MTGLVRKATLLSMLGLVVASVAMASVPDANNSTLTPNVVRLSFAANGPGPGFGAAAFTPYAGAQFTVRVKDAAGNDIANSSVVVDFNLCGPDIRLCDTQPAQEAGFTLINDCAVNKTVRMLTNGSGIAVFLLTGASRVVTSGTESLVGSVRIYADGVLIESPSAASYDEDGAGGITATDLGLWASDFFNATRDEERADFDGNLDITATDLGLWASAFFNSGLTASCSPYCAGM